MIGPRFACNLFMPFMFFSLAIFCSSPLSVQMNSTREELKGLQKQIDDLRETQRRTQKELEDVKAFLRGEAAFPTLPTQNLTVSSGNKPFKGNRNAKLTLIEFSDYQCPFCARFFRETLPKIEQDYIATGVLKYVLRAFPLEAIHKDAFRAAEAAGCAAEQGKYWEMHDRLFHNQNQLAAKELLKHADAVGLDLPTFQGCLDTGKHTAEIRKSIEEGRKLGVQATPTFLLGIEEPDRTTIKVLRSIVGAQPYDQFKQVIEGALSQIQN